MNVKDVIDRAATLATTTRLAKNLVEYEKQIEQEPRNPRLWLRHGELSERLGDAPLAVVSYRTAALLLGDRHEYNQAAAALRLALKLAPEDEILRVELKRIEALRGGGLSEFYARAITERAMAPITDGPTQLVQVDMPLAESNNKTEIVLDHTASD
jgi:hypothetical protein